MQSLPIRGESERRRKNDSNDSRYFGANPPIRVFFVYYGDYHQRNDQAFKKVNYLSKI